jgi:hypothetical protein
MDDLRLCVNSFVETNEISNDMLMLKDCGVKGVIPETRMGPDGLEIDESTIPVVQIFYDFKPSATDNDPVLLFFDK